MQQALRTSNQTWTPVQELTCERAAAGQLCCMRADDSHQGSCVEQRMLQAGAACMAPHVSGYVCWPTCQPAAHCILCLLLWFAGCTQQRSRNLSSSSSSRAAQRCKCMMPAGMPCLFAAAGGPRTSCLHRPRTCRPSASIAWIVNLRALCLCCCQQNNLLLLLCMWESDCLHAHKPQACSWVCSS